MVGTARLGSCNSEVTISLSRTDHACKQPRSACRKAERVLVPAGLDKVAVGCSTLLCGARRKRSLIVQSCDRTCWIVLERAAQACLDILPPICGRVDPLTPVGQGATGANLADHVPDAPIQHEQHKDVLAPHAAFADGDSAQAL